MRVHFKYGAEVSEDDNFILWPTDGERIALTDGDMIPYIVGFTVSEMTYVRALTRVKSGQVPTLADTPECKAACDRVNAILNSWVFTAKCDAARIFMTSSADNFRLRLAFSHVYKGERNPEKPPFFYEMREHLLTAHAAILSDGDEADDLMSIHQWNGHREFLKESGGEFPVGSPEHRAFSNTVIVSADKDLMIVPGWHMIPGQDVVWVDTLGHLELRYKSDGKTVKDLKGSGLKFFYAQMICGDKVDNYKGIPGRGAAFAYNLLNKCKDEKSLYMAVLGAYKAKFGVGAVKLNNFRGTHRIGKAFDIMLEQGRLAHMAHFSGDIWRSDKNAVTWGDSNDWSL